MELNKEEISVKKIHRKKFFISLGTGFLGFMFFNSIPLKFFTKKEMEKETKLNVRINPLAVSRKKTDGKNA